MAFYERLGPDHFASTEHTRGPWSLHHQHGGPPSALCADAVLGVPGFQLVQLSVDFVRPVPIQPLRRTMRWLREGRMRRMAAIELHAGEQCVAEARAILLRQVPIEVSPMPSPTVPSPEESAEWRFDFFPWPVGYHTAMDLRLAAGVWGEGPTKTWMRMGHALIDGDPIAPITRALVAADAGHGVAPCLELKHYTLVNPSLTVVIDRPPVGEWVLMDSQSRAQPNGIGHMSVRLADSQGTLGQVMAPLIAGRRPETK
jgi:hypothetical protein